MLVRVKGGVEDSIPGTRALFEEAGCGEVGEVGLAEVVDVVAGYDVFDPDVTVLCVAALHFGERGVAGRWPEPGDYGSVDVGAIVCTLLRRWSGECEGGEDVSGLRRLLNCGHSRGS